jgi:hypothetical protein
MTLPHPNLLANLLIDESRQLLAKALDEILDQQAIS